MTSASGDGGASGRRMRIARSTPSARKSNGPLDSTIRAWMSGWTATKSGRRGISHFMAKVGRHETTSVRVAAGGLGQGGLDLVQRQGQGLGQGRAGLGERQVVARALGQGHAEMVLKLADLPADRPVGDAQLVGRQGHPAAPAERLEGAQGVERRERAGGHVTKPHRCPLISRYSGKGNRLISAA